MALVGMTPAMSDWDSHAICVCTGMCSSGFLCDSRGQLGFDWGCIPSVVTQALAQEGPRYIRVERKM